MWTFADGSRRFRIASGIWGDDALIGRPYSSANRCVYRTHCEILDFLYRDGSLGHLAGGPTEYSRGMSRVMADRRSEASCMLCFASLELSCVKSYRLAS